MSELGSILLVEDSLDDEALTLRALDKAGIANRIEVARDGAAALERLHGPEATLPRVVLLDLKLPKLDGLEVLRRLRAHPRTRLLPVVVLTSSDLDDDLAQSYELGANAYVRKPVEFGEFSEAVRQLGLFWFLVNRPPGAPRT